MAAEAAKARAEEEAAARARAETMATMARHAEEAAKREELERKAKATAAAKKVQVAHENKMDSPGMMPWEAKWCAVYLPHPPSAIPAAPTYPHAGTPAQVR